SDWQRLRCELAAAGRQRHWFHRHGGLAGRQVAGAAQGDRCSMQQSGTCYLPGPVEPNATSPSRAGERRAGAGTSKNRLLVPWVYWLNPAIDLKQGAQQTRQNQRTSWRSTATPKEQREIAATSVKKAIADALRESEQRLRFLASIVEFQ